MLGLVQEEPHAGFVEATLLAGLATWLGVGGGLGGGRVRRMAHVTAGGLTLTLILSLTRTPGLSTPHQKHLNAMGTHPATGRGSYPVRGDLIGKVRSQMLCLASMHRPLVQSYLYRW